MLFVQDRFRPVFVPTEFNGTNCSVCLEQLLCCFPHAEREGQELEREREEREAHEEQEKQKQLLADGAAELERMKKEQQRLQEELDALRSGKVCLDG